MFNYLFNKWRKKKSWCSLPIPHSPFPTPHSHSPTPRFPANLFISLPKIFKGSYKSAENKACRHSIQHWKGEQIVSFLSEETDIASFLNTSIWEAFRWELCWGELRCTTLLSLMQVWNKVSPFSDHPLMNGHSQSGIYDLAQTPCGEIIRKRHRPRRAEALRPR